MTGNKISPARPRSILIYESRCFRYNRSMIRLALVLMISVFVISKNSHAFKPYAPKVSEYRAYDGQIQLRIPREGHPELRVNPPAVKQTTRYLWKESKVHLPSQVAISARHQLVFLLGGLGDPGMRLGVIEIYSFEGQRLRLLDLHSEITNLEKMAVSLHGDMGNFPWITSVALSADETALEILVCGAYRVSLALPKLEIKISRI